MFLGHYLYNKYLTYPWKNSNPKYFITVKGHVDPSLVHLANLKWKMIYFTMRNNKLCTTSMNIYTYIEGAISPLEKTLTYVVKPNAKGNYKFKIPLDGLKNGFCDWKIYDARIVLNAPYTTPLDITHFSPCTNAVSCADIITTKQELNLKYKLNVSNNLYCKLNSKNLSCTVRKYFNIFNNSSLIVPRKNDYSFTLNIYKRTK